MLIVFEIAPEMNDCAAAIMWMWLSTLRKRLPFFAAWVGAIKDVVVLFLQERRAFQRHRAQNVIIRSFDVLAGEAR